MCGERYFLGQRASLLLVPRSVMLLPLHTSHLQNSLRSSSFASFPQSSSVLNAQGVSCRCHTSSSEIHLNTVFPAFHLLQEDFTVACFLSCTYRAYSVTACLSRGTPRVPFPKALFCETGRKYNKMEGAPRR